MLIVIVLALVFVVALACAAGSEGDNIGAPDLDDNNGTWDKEDK